MKRIAFIFCAAIASFCSPVHAGSLRCDGDLVLMRDIKVSVLQKCGEPFFTESFCKPVDPATLLPNQFFVPCQLVEDWAYNPGPGQLITIVRFEGGMVTSIRYGERVK